MQRSITQANKKERNRKREKGNASFVISIN